MKGDNCSFRHDINKRGKSSPSNPSPNSSCGRVSENHRGPEVPEVKVRVVECRDGLARITLEELAITHSVKDGILQNACSTKTRMIAVLGKSAHSHIVRLTHSRRNGPNRIMTKRCCHIEKEKLARERVCLRFLSRSNGETCEKVVRNWDKIHLEVSFLMHDNWVAYFRT